ncbi:tRNA (guanine-N(7)-)-methyltransferase [uncultured Gammaproteobacteria bacterium]
MPLVGFQGVKPLGRRRLSFIPDAKNPTAMDQPRFILYGRRHGRPLRKHKVEVLETLLPQVQLDLPAPGTLLDPPALFPVPVSAVWLEVGFGAGEHLAAQAVANPDVGLIGCEPFINGVAGLLDKIEQADVIERVRILPDDARPLLDALPEASIGRCFVLFSDPWPKTRHHNRRFIGPENLPRLARVLADGAELRLASDDPALITWMLDYTWHHPDFEWLATRAADWRVRTSDWPETRYERKAIEAGRTPVFLRFRRRFRTDSV